MCDKPCASCPWLRANQTKQAVAASPVDGRGVHWFATSNLRARWTFVAKEGGMLPCHATDNEAHLYGGKQAPTEQGRVCVGLSVLARREVRHFMECGTDYAAYQLARGIRMSLLGLASWAARFNYAGSIFEVGDRQLMMPTLEEEDDSRIGTPWADRLHGQDG